MKVELNIPSDLQDFMRTLGALPRFASEADILIEALYRFRDEYDLQCLKRDRLREELQSAVDQAERGEMVDGPAFMAQLRERAKAHAGA